MRTLAVINQKGGCGKTTTAINLAGVFASRGLRTLLVDMDPQGHCAAGLAIPEQRVDLHIGDAMLAPDSQPVDPKRLLWRVSRNLDLAPSTVKLAALEAARGELAQRSDAETRLKLVLSRFDSQYDICLIDCSPAIGMLAFNALVAAQDVIIPVETGFFSLQGATKQVNAIKAVGKRLGVTPTHRLLATMHDPSSVLSQDLLDELKRRFGGRVIPVVIRSDQALRESASFGQPVVEYARESTGARDYNALADWLVENVLRSSKAQERDEDVAPASPASIMMAMSSPKSPTPPTPTPTPSPVVPLAAPVQVVEGIGERVLGPSSRPESPVQGSSAQASSVEASRAPVAVQPQLAQAAAADAPATVAPADLALRSRAADVASRTRLLQRAVAIQDVEMPRARPGTAVAHAPAREPSQSVAQNPAAVSEADVLPRLFGVQLTTRGVLFVQPASIGQSVAIAGEFNGWKPEQTPMQLSQRSGMLEAIVEIKSGYNQYRLVVDGKWMPDPFNPVVAPNPFGGSNSVVVVPEVAVTRGGT